MLCFYSKYCAYSRKVMDLIDNSQVRMKCVKICVDDKPRSQLPKTVQAVPTLIDRMSGRVHVGESITTTLFGMGQTSQISQFPGSQITWGDSLLGSLQEGSLLEVVLINFLVMHKQQDLGQGMVVLPIKIKIKASSIFQLSIKGMDNLQ